jgi:SAM-dependent methyltransferase
MFGFSRLQYFVRHSLMQEPSSHSHPIAYCPVCAARRFEYLFSIQASRLMRCTECGFTLLNPQPSDQKLAAIYSHDYFLGANDPKAQEVFNRLKRQTAELYLAEIARYSGRSGGKLLEIGSGSGDMLVTAAAQGYEVTGVEYSPYACAEARHRLAAKNLPGEVLQGEIETVAERSGQYDACVMADLIEHVRNPRRLLEVVHRVLKPGGVILIATPTLDSFSARLMGVRWMEYKPEHLSYFNRRTLEGLLFSEGYRCVNTLPGYKILNYNYIQEHFEKFPVPIFTLAFKVGGFVLPVSLRSRDIKIVASGMVTLARREAKPSQTRLSIIIPVYNEAATFRTAFDRILAHNFADLDLEFIVVESNSTDGTRAMVQEYEGHPHVTLVWEDQPKGKGHAVRTGLKVATGDFIAIQDADLEYDMEDYDTLLEPLLTNRESFVLGARHGGRASKMRDFTRQPILSALFNLGHIFFALCLNAALGVWLKDPFTMFKIFRRDCIDGLTFSANRFDFDWELVIKLIRRGHVPVELPVNYVSRSFKQGKKVSMFADPISWMLALVKYRFEKLPPPLAASTNSPHRLP